MSRRSDVAGVLFIAALFIIGLSVLIAGAIAFK